MILNIIATITMVFLGLFSLGASSSIGRSMENPADFLTVIAVIIILFAIWI